MKEYERRFGDYNKTHENENDNKQEIQSSESEGHEHDNLINGIRERELHTPLLEKYERILGNSNNIYENKHEIQSLGAEGHKRNDDFIQVQAHKSISKGYERSTDATANWHNYSEQKLKDLNDAYPKNMKKGDRRSILYNEGTHKLDSAEHEQRLDAMAYKATDWFMNHAVSFEKDPKKAKLIADQIRNSFDTTDKAAALLLLEAVEMQKEYDQQSKFQKYRRVLQQNY